ncbi:serine acetyltransferase [Sphingorhabdus lutea]|uniref:serine O-acetyltransferase n=1 Tax=Sphingorhabdus lutea TaxID=1913578 RepID=A0A1L3JAX2_9SPHN|nr:serine O-acetyltransferase EpsC [Sphingorhabdus lutea]APG62203.1 serine acetyltransferase [Sphingorhabdus lutea]
MAKIISFIDSIIARDPAPRSRMEILLYPGLWAIFLHHIAHWLFQRELFFVARLVNHISRFLTGIDIHPGAQIGKNLFIDHGFSVIGETAEIGDNVTIYQNVTLGGTNPTNGISGKRHPTIMDNVIIGSGAQILGPINVGVGARIGAAAVVTDDVDAGATMVGIKARPIQKEKPSKADIENCCDEFMPYGTPCEEIFDPTTQQFELLQCQIDMMKKEIGRLNGELAKAQQNDLFSNNEIAKPASVKKNNAA